VAGIEVEISEALASLLLQMRVDTLRAAAQLTHAGVIYHLRSLGCARAIATRIE
jgi:hypothetical protein